MARAVGEALRNVARHSGTDEAELIVAAEPDSLVTTITDHGRGVDPAHRPGFGMTRSLISPITDLGGDVEFAETPGGGLTLRLRLPLTSQRSSGPLEHSYDLTLRATGSAPPVALIAAPITATFTAMGLRHSFTWSRPAVSLLLAVLLTGLTIVLIDRLRHRPPTGRWYAAMTVAILACEVVGLAQMPSGGLLDGRGWTVGYLAVPVMMLVLTVPPLLGVATSLLCPLAVVVAWRIDPALSHGQVPVGAMQAAVLLPLIGVGLGLMLRAIGTDIRREEAALAAASLERVVRRSAALISDRHLAHTHHVVMPWLLEIADGREDLDDPEVAELAARYAAEVRDDLYAPGFFDATLRSAAAAFRARGGRLRLRPGVSPSGGDQRIGDLLRGLLERSDGRHTLTVIPPTGPDDSLRVSVLPPLGDLGDILGRVPARVIDDEFRTVISLDGRAPVSTDQPTRRAASRLGE
ncbi:ATP-binding protein [Aeromicrobium sp.]|uniref:ATP-binding protein n=1 Tax=Aeromicrobium sp. TaxID=1871063 RepID=UPI0039E53027